MENKEEWLAWRKKGLGSSDAPIIMGVSPWKTPYELWLEKTGRAGEQVTNWAMERGNKLEPRARALFEVENDKSFPAKNVVHSEYDFLRASLDGWCEETGEILEIKCPGVDDHIKAKQGILPEKYYPQVQHQLMVTGAKRAYYYSFDGKEGATVIVEPDLKYINALLLAEKNFWVHVAEDVPPNLNDRDWVEPSGEIAELFDTIAACKELMDMEKARYDHLKKKIIKAAVHNKMRWGKVEVQKIIKIGAVDYKKIPALTGVDLDKYRSKGSASWRITVKK